MHYLTKDLYRARRAVAGGVAIMALATGCASIQGPGTPSQDATSVAVASQRALEYLPDMESLHWTEPGTGHNARVTVLETLNRDDGQFCRLLFIETLRAPDGVIERYCRDMDAGVWRFDGSDVGADRTSIFGIDQPVARL